MEVVKVSAHSVPKSVAGAIAAVIREKNEVEVQAVGAGAANQAVKSIAIARSYMALVGVDLIFRRVLLFFDVVKISGSFTDKSTKIRRRYEKNPFYRHGRYHLLRTNGTGTFPRAWCG